MQIVTTTTKSEGFIFDMNKCVGCQACSLACSIENNNGTPFRWRNIHSSNEFNYSQAPLFYLSLACNHCEDAPCIKGCPTNAYHRDIITNAVLIDSKKCIGCNYCSWVCPYDAPQMSFEEGVMQKCTFCTSRIAENTEPACVTNCPIGALDYGIINIERNNAPGFTENWIKPKIQIIPLKKDRKHPEMDYAIVKPDDETEIQFKSKPLEKISLKHEWGLAVFTFIIPLLFAYFYIFFEYLGEINPFVFFGLAAFGAILSLAHLKKPSKAYKAILNIKKSWLSREILFFTLFMILSAIAILTSPENQIIKYIAAFSGFFCLISIDLLYRNIACDRKKLFRTGSAILIAFYLISLWSFQGFLFIVLARIVLYLIHKLIYIANGQKAFFLMTLIRLLFGFLIPVFLVQNHFYLLLISILIGELIERLEFYMDLRIITPEKQLKKDIFHENN